MWPKAINVVLSISTSFPLALSVTLYLHKLDSRGYSEDDLAVCFQVDPLLFGWACMTATYIVIIMTMCFIFTYRVVRTLKLQMVQASKRTKDMQRALTITLLLSALIPTILGMLPVLLGLYLLASKEEHMEYLIRTIYITCVLEGLLNIICTIVLVKPYRDVLRSWACFKKNVIYPEILSTLLGVFAVVNAIFLPFLYRYCHVCHPKSFYCINPLWPKGINVALSIATSFLLALPATLHIYLYKLESRGYSEDDIVVCFLFGPVLLGWTCTTAAYIVIIMTMCFIFTYRVVRTLKLQMVQASKRTKDMQRALTITLLLSALIPTILGVSPILLFLYLLASKEEHMEYLLRTIYITCVLEGLLNIICTIVLVKPYRDVLRSWDSRGHTEDDLAVCFQVDPVLFGWGCMTATYIVIIMTMCFIFTYRVVRILKLQMVQASKRTKDMQRALTITLLLSALIPTILGMLPVLLGLYLLASKEEHMEYLIRTIYITCVLEGLLNIICTIVLVKPYRDVLRSWACFKKSETVISVVSNMK
ncbi:hypothetical protein QR680_010832 [Steinernema hermaphroditum]|uniref:Uncharacterized protein n=1 Tax=Steinernema hermaphroditum TaxID=289476 RepID=A0AA39MCG1_9BILA|nr:hypothetical protein QR680_010832 [Steinernema hermaphroditum]